jgi:two-component system, NtrC family, response regulator GlrR
MKDRREHERIAFARREFVDMQLVGGAGAFKHAVSTLRLLADTEAKVLVSGESGTGKELAARVLHYAGARAGMPFVAVNCGGIPDSLFESELFGYERGAFTGATQARRGLIAEAENGTLFLDEVDSLSARAQAALLRFLEELEYRPLGARRNLKSNVRVVSATNRVLPEQVRKGAFRDDLLFRLAVVSVPLPPLREREGDIALLARHFAAGFAAKYGKPEKRLTPGFLGGLEQYRWPGNVRELMNFIHGAFLLSPGDELTVPRGAVGGPASMPPPPPVDVADDDRSLVCAKRRAADDIEREYVLRALVQTRGNVTRAARLVGKERRTFGRLVRKHGFDRSTFDPGAADDAVA